MTVLGDMGFLPPARTLSCRLLARERPRGGIGSPDLPDDIRRIVERNRDDERRHLDYIEKTLRDRTWEQRPQP